MKISWAIQDTEKGQLHTRFSEIPDDEIVACATMDEIWDLIEARVQADFKFNVGAVYDGIEIAKGLIALFKERKEA